MTEAFATSVLWGFEAAAETDGRVLVDATAFVLRDVHDVVRSLKPASYSLDASRSAVNLARTKAFPRNTELDAILTFTGSGDNAGQTGGGLPGGRVTDVAPTATAVTVQQHHSFVRLPDARLRAAAVRSARRRLRRRPGPTSRRRCPSR